jgi:hypothetical protein
MGYWGHTPKGKKKELIWGDAPADVLDNAVDQIIGIFVSDMGRKPTKAELLYGMEFCSSILEDWDDIHKRRTV